MAEHSPPRSPLLKTLPLNTELTSFSPTSGYPGLDLYRYLYLVCAVQDYVHSFDHRLLQPGLCVGSSYLTAVLIKVDLVAHSQRG
jgi:hypothetical protein